MLLSELCRSALAGAFGTSTRDGFASRPPIPPLRAIDSMLASQPPGMLISVFAVLSDSSSAVRPGPRVLRVHLALGSEDQPRTPWFGVHLVSMSGGEEVDAMETDGFDRRSVSDAG